jgi:hypothetical protein
MSPCEQRKFRPTPYPAHQLRQIVWRFREVEELVCSHTTGAGNHTTVITALLTTELIHRTLLN